MVFLGSFASEQEGALSVHHPVALVAIKEYFWRHFWARKGNAVPVGARIPGRALAIWKIRPDLQKKFALESLEGREGLYWWYLLHGLGDWGLECELGGEQVRILNRRHPLVPSRSFTQITWLMRELWRRQPWFPGKKRVVERVAQDQFLAWYFTRALMEAGLGEFLTESQAAALLVRDRAWSNVERIRYLIWSSDTELQTRFADVQSAGFREWCRTEGAKAYPILCHPLIRLGDGPDSVANRSILLKVSANPHFGVNLIGHARGRFGIGEDVRMAALACRAANIPFVVHNIDAGSQIREEDRTLDEHITGRLPYATNLFCMTGMETVSAGIRRGPAMFDGRRNIGNWPWELPEWPQEWHHAYELVDEIWASSRFTYDAYLRSSPKPVRHVPMAVAVDASEGWTRQHFGLPDDQFLFVFAFDFLSALARKNPHGCVAAFREAFASRTPNVGLVIKAMRAKDDNPIWQALREEAARDGRIHLVTESLSRGGVLDLFRVCDCFISLHRSEGFGRGIAEAMMLGRPVIVTGESGNMDFTMSDTAGIVNYRKVQVMEGEYPFGGGQTWAEPDIDHAAEWMRLMATNVRLRERLAVGGQDLMMKKYSPAAVGSAYAALLGDELSTVSIPRRVSVRDGI